LLPNSLSRRAASLAASLPAGAPAANLAFDSGHASNAVLPDLTAEAERARAEAIILSLANPFAPDDPLRHAFLDAAPVRRILRVGGGNKGTRQRRAQS